MLQNDGDCEGVARCLKLDQVDGAQEVELRARPEGLGRGGNGGRVHKGHEDHV